MIIRSQLKDEPEAVTVYGAAWCEDTTRVRRLLNAWGVPYKYVDIDDNPSARRKIARWNQGWTETPTVTIGKSEVPRAFQPSDEMLHALIYECGLVRVGPLLL
jgi:glutaredoxin